MAETFSLANISPQVRVVYLLNDGDDGGIEDGDGNVVNKDTVNHSSLLTPPPPPPPPSYRLAKDSIVTCGPESRNLSVI